MKIKNLLIVFCLFVIAVNQSIATAMTQQKNSIYQYPDVLNLKGIPADKQDRTVWVLSDQGAWHGYALFPQEIKRLGFVGPFVMTKHHGAWLSKSFAEIAVYERGHKAPLDLTHARIQSHAYPGRLQQTAFMPGLFLKTTLVFADARRNLIKVHLKNTGDKPRTLMLALNGEKALLETTVKATGNRIVVSDKDNVFFMQTTSLSTTSAKAHVNKQGGFSLTDEQYHRLKPGENITVYYQQGVYFSDDKNNDVTRITNAERVFSDNEKRWETYLDKVLNHDSAWLKDRAYKKLAVKALMTLVTNWRGQSGDLTQDGMFPSYAYPGFHGVWSWDSWKQAVATVYFDPELAKSQLWVMFDYQDAHGMVPDVIYRNKKHNNWRDTKPPLASWAVWEIYQVTQDRAFLKKIYPRLVKYHQWWYKNRDHDGDGLAEYGSTDGTRIAAAWESGMDNGVRFDHSVMVKNSDKAWSLNQESVDLNSYLYQEKGLLANMASVLNKSKQAEQFLSQQKQLAKKVRSTMFNVASEQYSDILLDGSDFVDDGGISALIALWAQLASSEQAKQMMLTVMDESQFNTRMPLPTQSAAHKKFKPDGGYWRGPVWLDQAYFVIRGLQHYGYDQQANTLTWKLVHNAQGLLSDAPIYENYNPVNGAVLESPHFSWSAAHLLLLLMGR